MTLFKHQLDQSYAPRERETMNNREIKSKAMEYKLADNNEGKGTVNRNK